MRSMTTRSSTTVPVAARVGGFSYAIRNIVAEAKRVEAAGRRVRYLNIGDPIPFGFKTPPHLVEAVTKALHEGHNHYTPSPGIPEAREAVSRECARRGQPIDADRVVITTGTSEGIELALNALVNPGEEVLVPVPTYPLYTAVLAKIGARAMYYRTDPGNGWLPDLDHLRTLVSPLTRALVVIDPNNPTGAVYPQDTRRSLLALAEEFGFPIVADEVYADLAYDGPVGAIGALDPEVPLITFSSLSKAYLAPGWRVGWLAVGASPRLDGVLAAIKKLADGRLCSPGPMQYAVAPALDGDRGHQEIFRAELRARARVTTEALARMDGVSCVPPAGAFYAMPQVRLPPGRTDEDYVLGLLRETGVLCVYGSGFGLPKEAGFLRIVFLAPPDELERIYGDMAAFTRRFLEQH
jgi:alanine-synthesizing transaminase